MNAKEFLALGEQPRVIKEVTFPGTTSMYIRELMADEFNRLQDAVNDGSGDTVGLHAKTAAMVLCEKDGTPIYSLASSPGIGKVPAKYLLRIFNESNKLNSFSDEDVNKAGKD